MHGITTSVSFRPRGALLVAAVVVLVEPSPAAAQWTPTGAPLCATCDADFPTDQLVIVDGQGGLFAVWRDARDYPDTRVDVYLQRLTGTGHIAPGWPADGFGVCVAERDQTAIHTAPDGRGGALVTWIDQRGGNDIYVQRVQGDGTLPPGWPVNGAAATRAPASQSSPAVAHDGAGGAFVVWDDERDFPSTYVDVYAQHFDSTGAIVAGWPADGLPLAVVPHFQGYPTLFADGAGGVVVAWTDYNPAIAANDTRGVRLRGDGTVAPEWPTGGALLLSGSGRIPHLVSDDAGGFYVVGSTESATDPAFAGEYWVQRFSLDGAVAPGWPPLGLLVCQALGPREGLRVASDGAGGVLMTWYDYRTPGGVIFAARVIPSGTLAPGWTANGTLVSDLAAPGVEYDPGIAADGMGGAYVVWNVEYDGVPAYMQHLTAQGQVAAGWPQFGIRVAPTGAQFHPQIVSDGAKGAIVVWDERLPPRLGLYAQRFRLDGPVPTLLALASATAEPGVVRLLWHGAAAHLEATVERRSGASADWGTLAALTPDAAGRMIYEDRAVEPGTRYAYRLRWREDGTERATEEVWVEVPATLALALEGLRPNPAVRDLNVAFTLAASAPARLELLDVAGRQKLVRELGDLSPGRHVLRLDAVSPFEPGMYWLRLSQGTDQRVARAVIVR